MKAHTLLISAATASLFVFCSNDVWGQPGSAIWTNRYDPGSPTEDPVAVVADSGGNVIVAGSSWGGATGRDFATVKYSSGGTALWTNRVNGPANNNDYASAVAVDGGGSVYVTGYTAASNSVPFNFAFTTIKYTSGGSPVWTNRYKNVGNNDSFARALAVAGNGNVYVAGESADALTAYDFTTVAYSSSGLPLWTNRYGGSGQDYAQSLAVDSDNAVLVTGQSFAAGSGSDFATIKYSDTGLQLWVNRYNGPANGNDYSVALAVDLAGDVYVTGYSLGSGTSNDCATVKYSGAGLPLWTNRYSSPGNNDDRPTAIAVNNYGTVFVTGYSSSAATHYDYFTVAYSSSGVPLWTNQYLKPGFSLDWPHAIGADSSGNVFVTGQADADFVTIAYSTSGAAVWTNQYPGNIASSYDAATTLAVDGNGNIVVAGNSGVSGGGNLSLATVKYAGFPISSPTNLPDWTWLKGATNLAGPPVYGTQGVPAAANTPGARRSSAAWKGPDGKLYLFGGYGYGEGVGGGAMLNDLWRYDPATANWTWIKGPSYGNANGVYGVQGVENSANLPGARQEPLAWVDASGKFYLFGGYGLGETGTIGRLNDVWRFDPATLSWTWLKGSKGVNSNGIYGTMGVPASANNPGARAVAATWTDVADKFYVFGGYGYGATGVDGELNDLWQFDPATLNWTWLKGSTGVNSNGVYGVKGAAAAANVPGGREMPATWRGSDGRLYLFGGYGYPATGLRGVMNDLWAFDAATGNWTWLRGSTGVNSKGIYATLGTESPFNSPGARAWSVSCKSSDGNMILFGGYGADASGDQGQLNDVWLLNPATTNWTWLKGSSAANAAGVYGVQGSAGSTNNPGARERTMIWPAANGAFYLFGGYGRGTEAGWGHLNDLWVFGSPLVPLTTSVIGGGSVCVSPNQIAYAPGSVVQLTAVPYAGWNFQSWSPGGSTVNPLNLTLSTSLSITGNFAATASACAVAPAGLVAWWRGENDAADTIGGNHGVLQNGATAAATGQVGTAFNFDGVISSVDFGTTAGNFGTSNFTIEFWIKTTSTVNDAAILGKRLVCGGDNFWNLFVRPDGKIRLEYEQATGNNFLLFDTAASVNNGVFHYVAWVRQGTTSTIYIDGTASGSGSTAGVASLTNSAILYAGRNPCIFPGGASYFAGQLDEISFYNRALSLSEIQSIRAAGLAGSGKCLEVIPPPISGLVGWWPGDGHARDLIGGHNGVLGSGAGYTSGLVAQAFNFDGVDDHVQVGPVSSLKMTTAFTVEAWIYPTGPGTPGDGGIIVNKEGEYELWRGTNGTIYFAVANTSPGWIGINTGAVAPTNTWTHIAWTYDSTSLKTYTNGVIAHSIAGAGLIGDAHVGLDDFRIGGRQALSQFFQGRIDEVALFNRALSTGEIQQIYTAGAYGKCGLPPLLLAQPYSQTVAVGSNVTFLVSASGTMNIYYQWRKNGINIPGATAYNLVLSNVQASDAGVYSVVASNFTGVATSTNAVLSVIATLSVSTVGGGTVCVAPNQTSYTPGSVVQLTAVPYAGWNFQNWSPGGSTANPLNLTLNSSMSIAGVFSATASACAMPPANMVAWWRGQNDASDTAGNNHGTLVNGAAFAGARVGSGFSLDGFDDYVDLGNSTALLFANSSFTAEAWIYLTQAADGFNDEGIVSRYAHSSLGYGSWIFGRYRTGRLWFALDTNGLWPAEVGVVSTNILSLNQWHHVAGVYNHAAGNIRVYVDGTLNYSETNAPVTVYPSTAKVSIGAWWRYDGSDGVQSVPGVVDEVSLYNRALTDGEVAALYATGASGKCLDVIPPPKAGMVSWWPGNGNAHDIISAHNGTLQNGAAYANGVVGQAFNFDGVNDRVDTSLVMNYSQGATMEAWIKTTDADGMIMSDGGGSSGQGGMGLWVEGAGRLQLYGRTPASLSFSLQGPVVNDNAWHHVAATWDGTTGTGAVKLYVDGLPVTNGTAASPISQATQFLYLGAHANIAHQPFAGLLDEVTIYKRALSAAEIQDIYTLGSYGKCPVPLRITAINRLANSVAVTFDSEPGFAYVLQYKTNLSDAGWNSAASVIATGFSTTLTDSNLGDAPRRFYRVAQLPADYFASPGFADVTGTVTGGAAGQTVTVSNVTGFITYVTNAGPYVIQVQGPISTTSTVAIASHKTILGLGTNAAFTGTLHVNGQSNVIIRNLQISTPPGIADRDGIALLNGANRVWVDHCTFVDCTDGELDITLASDNVTVSWCKFHYTTNSGHNFVNLISADDSNTGDIGKLNVTFHHNWWSTLCVERMPRVRFGHIHSYNNYFNSVSNNYCIRAALQSEVRLENNYFEGVKNPWHLYLADATQTPGKVFETNNILSNVTSSSSNTNGSGNISLYLPGTNVVFTPPYSYTLDSAGMIPTVVTNFAGAGKGPFAP